MSLRRRTEYPEAAEVEIEQVRGGVYASEGPVEAEIVANEALFEAPGYHDLESVASHAVSYAFTNILPMLIVRQGRGRLPDCLEVIDREFSAFHDSAQHVQVVGFSIFQQLHKRHFGFESFEYYEVFIQDVHQVRCVIFCVGCIFHGDVFQVAYNIEGGVAVDPAVAGILPFYFEAVQELTDDSGECLCPSLPIPVKFL